MIKKQIKYIILFLIQLIEKYEYRNLDLDENDINKKIIDTIDVSDKNILVNTDTGFKKISHIHKTQPYQVYRIKTESGKVLECADNHIVFDGFYFNQIFVKDLHVGDSIVVKSTEDNKKFGSTETIISIEKLPFKISMYDVTVDDENHRFYTNDILSHNTITSSFYILWYICFHTDRNVLVVANKGDTMKEIMKKVQAVYDNLPYFLKPGLLTKNVKSLDFDNGCRIVGQETSETPGLGFTIHLLYADEFAHIPSNKKEPFFRSVMPTLSSSNISQAIFTSTPNKQDLFYRLYSKAIPWKESNDEIKKKRPFVSITTYWDAPPGRDEEWKAQQIELLGGSIENWNQEFECSFLSSDELFLDTFLINYLEKIKVKFVHKKISVFEDRNMDYSKLTFHPKFDIDEILPTDRFVISIDTSDGVGRDYFVANIFKIEPFSLAKIRKSKATTDELDFFRLRQIGLYHDNKTSIDEVMKILNVLFFDFFDVQQIRIVLEMNFKGDLIIEKLKRHKEYSPEVLMHTKHSESADTMMPGLKLQKKNKKFLVSELKGAMKTRKIILNDTTTIEEGKNFGVDKNGNFKSQTGKDDIIMSCVNVTSFLHSAEMIECVEDIFDLMDRDKKLAIEKIINSSDNSVTSDMEYYKMLQEYL